MGVLNQNLEILHSFRPLSQEQITELRSYGKQFDDGRYELFKSTVKYDGDLGRRKGRLNAGLFQPLGIREVNSVAHYWKPFTRPMQPRGMRSDNWER